MSVAEAARLKAAEAEADHVFVAEALGVTVTSVEVSPWFEDLVARRGGAFLRSPEGALVSRLVRLNFGEERAPALRELTTLLVGRHVPPLVALLLVETWAVRFCLPVPSEGETLALVAGVVEELRR